MQALEKIPGDTTVARAHRAGGMLATLQVGRAIAALAVVVHHANMSATDHAGAGPGFADKLGYGALGVDFFFVLSGFIIYYGSVGRTTNTTWISQFILRRAVRVFVPYWPIGIGLAVLYTALSGFGGGAHDFSWLSTVTLLPTDKLPALIPGWTLQYELFFYAAFALLLWTRLLWVGISIWAVVLVALWWPNGPGSNVFLASMNVEFVAGIVAAHLVLVKRSPVVFVASCGALLIVGFFIAGSGANSLFFGLGIAGLLPWVVRMERAERVRMPAFAILLGNASYAIYLVHNPLLALTTRVSVAVVGPNWWWALSVGIVGSALGGLVYHVGYELPAVRRMQDLVSRRTCGKVVSLAPGSCAR